MGRAALRRWGTRATAAGLAFGLLLLAGPAWAAAGDAPARVAAVKLGLALAGAVLLAWGAWLASRGRPAAHAKLRDALLAGLGIAGLLGWWNFSQFHYPTFVHPHDLPRLQAPRPQTPCVMGIAAAPQAVIH